MSVLGWIDCFREAIAVPSVTTFILISGFFSIHWNFKKFASFLYQVVFFIFVVHLTATAIGFPSGNLSALGGAISAITHVGKTYWFVDVYLVLLLFAPMTNDFIDKVPTKKLMHIIFFLLACAWMSIAFGSQQFRGNVPESFLIFYLLGRLVRRMKDEGMMDKIPSIVMFIGFAILALINTLLYVFLESRYSLGILVFGYESPLVICQALLLLGLSLKIEFRNQVVNIIASSSFAIYLLHMHYDLKQWYYQYTASLYDTSVLYHICSLLILFAVVSAVAFVLDRIRVITFEYAYNKITKK